MIPRDKLAHFLAGIAVAAVAYPFGLIAAMLATVIAAVGKELWDAQGNGTPEMADFLATVVGGGMLVGWYHLFGG
jgi:hypothetical protein